MTLSRLVGVLAAASLVVAACGDDTTAGSPTSSAAVSSAGSSAGSSPGASSAPGALDPRDWAGVLRAARGQTVNWYVYGGSDSINRFVDDTYGPVLRDTYGVTLHRVPVADTVDAVNQVLAEKKAGTTAGAVDAIWINGENFSALKQAGMLYGGWPRALPNASLVDWDNPAVNRDFGEPVADFESPWSSSQFQFIYDSARTDPASLPRSYAALKTWACAHPGRFTYIAPGPGAYQGTRFVKGLLFELSGGASQWASFDQARWDQWSPVLWTWLKDLRPCLWRQGQSYPKDENELHKLFANKEVDLSITLASVGASTLIADGLVPPTSRAFVFDGLSIGDVNYLAIPANASHKAAALVLANLLLDPAMQARQIVPANGFGLGYAIDPGRVKDAAQQQALRDAQANLGPGAAPAADLAKSLIGDAAAPYQDLVEKGWRKEVVGGL